jgi:hypothetical protein
MPDRGTSTRDAQSIREITEILRELPAAHPARVAFADGRPTMELVRLLRDHQDLVKQLMDSYWGEHRRQKGAPA